VVAGCERDQHRELDLPRIDADAIDDGWFHERVGPGQINKVEEHPTF
jgi:hypothetical protein